MGDTLESTDHESHKLIQTPSDTLVIHCADPRFRVAFESFIKNELGIEHFTLISIAGGAGAFASRDRTTGEVKVILEDLRLFLAGADLQRVIAFNHDLCLWYGKELPELDQSSMTKRQADDLRHLTIAIRSQYSQLRVDTYMAVVEGDKIRFRPEPVII